MHGSYRGIVWYRGISCVLSLPSPTCVQLDLHLPMYMMSNLDLYPEMSKLKLLSGMSKLGQYPAMFNLDLYSAISKVNLCPAMSNFDLYPKISNFDL